MKHYSVYIVKKITSFAYLNFDFVVFSAFSDLIASIFDSWLHRAKSRPSFDRICRSTTSMNSPTESRCQVADRRRSDTEYYIFHKLLILPIPFDIRLIYYKYAISLSYSFGASYQRKW